MDLYGYSDSEKNKFFYENNAMWGIDGVEITQGGRNATQGLSGAQLAGGSLTLAGGAIAPFFDEDFLKGNNSKHTVLGNVYHNVTFPFIKKALTSSADTSKVGTVDYWCFDSADQDNSNKNLRLKYDSSNGYFLQSTDKAVEGQTVESGNPTTQGNYFPLNSSSESGNACKLNYGFGQKLQLKFRLTQDGTVTTTKDEEVPIEFNFSGDDDVWVFIDDQLVLDVGGAHDVVSGRINFRDKKAWVSKVKNQLVGGFTDNKTSDFPASLKNDLDFYKKEHTLTMFYMERGMWESNMKVTFNFPDENQLQVEKQVDTTDVNDLFKGLFEGTDLFNFTIKNLATHYGAKATASTGFVTKQYDIADYGSAESGKLENPTGAVYTSSAKSGAYAIDKNGTFVLQDKETITFRDQFRRGSYIYLKEEVDPNLFDTTWTMFENGQLVTSMGTGGTVTNGSVSDFNKMEKRLSVNDGRTEVYKDGKDTEGQTIDNAYKGKKPSEDTFVFRSYAKPDDTTTLTKLKAVFYNKVKTGSLTIKKKAAYPTDQLDGTYKFKLTFTNVGGAGLETKPIEVTDIFLKANESYTITGIPIGTFFTIEEITPTDGSTLDSISLNEVPQEAGVLHGDINATKPEAVAVFKNTKKQKVNLSVEKLWKTASGKTYTGTLPDKIYVQLQRRSPDKAVWEAVLYNNRSYTELTCNEEWKTSFEDLDKFDYTQSPQDAWQYRIVEVTVKKGADGKVTEVTPVENGGCIEFTDASGKRSMFKVSYDYANTNSDSGGFARITNTYQPLTDIQIQKIKAGTAGDNPEKLAGAEFKLEKLTADGKNAIDSAFEAQTVTTGDGKENGELGSAKFKDLEDGTYQITETKAPERYNLLKSPIKVVINRSENSITVDGKNSIRFLEKNTLTIQVANQAKFQLPATGSWSRLILGFTGAIIAGTAVIMYLLLQKRRKEGKTS